MNIKSAAEILHRNRYLNRDVDGFVDEVTAARRAMIEYALQYLDEIEKNVILIEVKYIKDLKEKIRRDR